MLKFSPKDSKRLLVLAFYGHADAAQCPHSEEQYSPTVAMWRAECDLRVPGTRPPNWVKSACKAFLERNPRPTLPDCRRRIVGEEGMSFYLYF